MEIGVYRVLQLQQSDKLVDYYELDVEKGAINTRSRKNRVFVLGSEAWSSLLRTVYGKFSSGAAVILYNMGKPYGAEIAKNLELDKTLTSLGISKIGRISGWGTYSVQGEFRIWEVFHVYNQELCFLSIWKNA